MRFWDEFFFLMALAVGIMFFVAGFVPLFKVASGHIPVQGLQEALAASS